MQINWKRVGDIVIDVAASLLYLVVIIQLAVLFGVIKK